MDDRDCSSQAFVVRLWPAERFYQGLAVMKELSESAVLLVRTGEVELRVSTPSGTGIASMIFNASTAFPSSSSSSFAFRFNVLDLMDLLGSAISESDSKSLWIFKMIKSPALRFLTGMDSRFNHFNKVEEITPYTSDLRALQLAPFRVILPTRHLRELISACASDQNADFHLSFSANRVTWTTSNSDVVRHIKDGKCVAEGVAAEVEGRLVAECLDCGEGLVEASREAGVVEMSPVASPGMSNWIAFHFRFNDGCHLMFLVRGLKHLTASRVGEDDDVDNNDDIDEGEDEGEDEDSDNNDGEDVDYNDDEDEDSDVDNNEDEDEEDGVHDNDSEDEDEGSDNSDGENEEDDVHNKDGDGWILV